MDFTHTFFFAEFFYKSYCIDVNLLATSKRKTQQDKVIVLFCDYVTVRKTPTNEQIEKGCSNTKHIVGTMNTG